MNEDNIKDAKTITIRKDALWKYSTFALLGIIVVGLVFFVFSGDKTTGNVVRNGNVPSPSVPGASGAVVQISEDDDPVLGDENAPVTIIEFSDYQCPFCRKFWTETLPSIQKDYIDEGKVKLVYRDFPLGFHPAAILAAEAANCARDKGGDEAYFKMHDKIFQEQNVLDGGDANNGPVKSTVQFTEEDLKTWAKGIGYNIDSCLDSGKYVDEIQKDLGDGSSAGVQGTPGFFVNGKPVSGAQPYNVFKQLIEAELA